MCSERTIEATSERVLRLKRMDELRVPKRRASVELSLVGGQARKVHVFLTDFAAGHSGAERLSDLLNGNTEFIPAVDDATGAVFVFNRTGVTVARAALDVEHEDVDEHSMATEHEVEVTLNTGQRLRGRVAYTMPSDRSRLTDHLNDAPRFIRLFQDTSVALINKSHVTHVETPNKL
jgi:hypothetical protein